MSPTQRLTRTVAAWHAQRRRGRAWRASPESSEMPEDSRARTRAVRAQMAATGQTYTQAAATLDTPRMNRDLPPAGPMVALMFAELMTTGRRAAVAQEPGLPAEAAAAVQAARSRCGPTSYPKRPAMC